MNTLNTKRITILGINVAMFVLYLLGWVKASISTMFAVETGSASMFGLAGLMRDLSDMIEAAVMWIGSGEAERIVVTMNVITVFFYVLIVGMLGGLLLNLWDTLFKSGKKILGYVLITGITAFIILAVLIINAVMEEKIGYGSLLRLSFAPFLTLVLAGGGIFAVKKMPEGAALGGQINTAMSSIKDSKAMANLGSSIKSAAQRGALGAKRFPIYYYSATSRIRPVSAQLTGSNGALRFDFVSYATGPITAIRADIELVTAFCEAIKVEKMSFINLARFDEKNCVRYSTELVNTGVNSDVLRQIHEIRIYPTEVVINGELYKCGTSANFKKTGIPLYQLDAMRAAKGLDVMENAIYEKDRWRCCCGTVNAFGQICRLCGRSMEFYAPAFEMDDIMRPTPAVNTNTNAVQEKVAKRCPACGEVLERETVFCYKCGAKLK